MIETESFSHKVLEASLNGVYIFNLKTWKHVYVNRQYTTMTGYTFEDLLEMGDMRFFDLFHPEDKRSVMKLIDRITSGEEEMLEIEFRLKTKDGRWIWCLSRNSVFARASDGSVSQLIGSFLDITDRKLAEEAMRASEAQKSFLLRMGDVLRPLTDAIEIQARAARLLGEYLRADGVHYGEVLEDGETFVIRKDFYGKGESPMVGSFRFEDFGSHVTSTLKSGKILRSNDCGQIPGLSDKQRAAYAALGIRAQVSVPLVKNGRLEAILTARQAQPHNWTGEEVTLIAEAAERTWEAIERSRAEEATRRSEAQFRQLADAMPQLVWTAKADGRVIYCNERYKEYSGIRRLADGTFLWSPILHEKDRAATTEMWRRAVQTGEAYQMEHRIKLKDGGYHWHLSRAIPTRDRHGNIVKWFGTATDIDQVKRTEEELRKLTENLEQRVAKRTELAEARTKQLQSLAVELIEAEERERRRIAKLLHDDLQQIMASAKFQLQAAQRSYSPEPLLENVIFLLEESIAKSRSLSHELSPPILRHSSLIDALGWLARQMEEKFGLQVELIADTERTFENKSLKAFLFRAVQELLFNVVKHAGVKTARVTYTGSKRGYFIVVSDYGRGFDPGFLNFSDTTSGLGLLSMRERAHYLGGGLKIESVPGKGSRFILSVPLDLDDTAQPLAIEAAIDGQPPAMPDMKEKGDSDIIRVLFVDDHQVMRQGLIQLLAAQPDIEPAGEACNGLEAVEQALAVKPDVILMDVSMPEMDGIEATRRIKEKLPDVRVIGLSMFQDEQISRVMHEAGAEAFVTKTASSAELLKAIYDVGRRRRV